MAQCQDISPKTRKLCIGALKNKVGLYTRDLASPAFGSQDNQQEYALVANIYAAVKTVNGIDIFDDINAGNADGVPGTATIFFFVRHRTDVTAENFIQYRGINYDILRVEQIDLEQRFLKIFAAPRGEAAFEAAL